MTYRVVQNEICGRELTVKGHYYGPTFYNYPYTFGLPFGLGLYSQYLKTSETARFEVRDDEFLSPFRVADAVTHDKRYCAGVDS